jgi:hypothetical protein
VFFVVDWGDVPEIMEEGTMGSEKASSSPPSRPDVPIDAEEAYWSDLPYDRGDVLDIVGSNSISGYGDEAEEFRSWLNGEESVSGVELAASIKVGAHLTGCHITYDTVIEAQNCDVVMETVYREAADVKDRIGLEDELDWYNIVSRT